MYKIIGIDSGEYGPVAAEQLRQWIAEGRANAQTPVLGPGAREWKPLGTLPEFAGQFAPPVPPAIGSGPGTATAGQLPKTSSFATAGLIFGILSATCCCCGCPFSVIGLVCSLIGLSQINRHPERYTGRGLAIAGLILSAVSLMLGFGLTLLHLALPPGNFAWHFSKTF